MNYLKTGDREAILKKKRVVVKVGTSSITYENGKVNFRYLDHLTRQLADLKNRGLDVVLVTSGAIGVGLPMLGFHKKPDFLPYKQAAAAVGQGALMNTYEHLFHEYGQTVGQLLFTKGDAVNSKRYLYMRGTIQALLELGAIPIVNENDAVSADEIKIGDNDTLAAEVARSVGAQLLILLSDIDGLYTADPHTDPNAKLLPVVNRIDEDIKKLAGVSSTAQGTGGMVTKLRAAEICLDCGCEMVIANGNNPAALYDIVEGLPVGTRFVGEKT